MNLFDMLKAEKNIPVSDPMARLWGYQYQQKHGVSEISGVPPLLFKSRGGYLQDYRIDGTGNETFQNGLGIPTENMFDISSSRGFVSNFTDWSQSIDGKRITVDCSRISGVAHGLSLSLGTLSAGTYNFHIVWDIKPSTVNIRYVSGNTIATITNADTTFFLPEDAEIELYIVALKRIYTFEDIMLTEGSHLPSEYIPYGYRITFVIDAESDVWGTTFYIGSEKLYSGEYILFSEQKIYKMAEGGLTPTEPPVPFPAIPTFVGINRIYKPNTTIWIKGKIKAID